MMAVERTTIELVSTPGMLVMLFEDISHGNLRTFYLNRPHRENLKPTLQGDSIAHWVDNVLVIDTTGLSDRSWLDDTGAHPSESLHLIERIRLLQGGTVLEYKLRAEDPNTLAKPYSYTRYYERVREIHERFSKDRDGFRRQHSPTLALINISKNSNYLNVGRRHRYLQILGGGDRTPQFGLKANVNPRLSTTAGCVRSVASVRGSAIAPHLLAGRRHGNP